MSKILICASAILIAVLLMVDILLFINGTFEIFPTEEQIEKARIFYGIIFVILSVAEAVVIRLINMKYR